MKSRIYLDYNATAPLHSDARAAMLKYLGEWDANPSALYLEAEQVRGDLEQARKSIASDLGIRAGELFFTSGATESINWAIRGIVAARPEKKKFVTTRVEHSATLDIANRLAASGLEVVWLDVDESGQLNPADVEEALDDDVAILSLLWTNNETGVEFDIAEIGEIARRAGVIFHVDAVQKVGKGLPRLLDMPVDLLSFSGHKFGAAKGTGGLYVRRGVGLRPLIWGGKHETGRRGGTENVAGIIGMASALRAACTMWPDSASAIRSMRDRLQAKLVAALPDLKVNGDCDSRNENTLSVCYPGIEGHGVVLTLSQKGLACASGSACTGHDEGPSHVLEAMGVDGRHIHGALRFSLGFATEESDVDLAAELVIDAIRHVARI